MIPGARGAIRALLAGAVFGAAVWAGEVPDFRREIAPVLVEQCLSCHGPERQRGRYRVDTVSALRRAGVSGEAAVVAGDAEGSLLMRLLTADDPEERMPQGGEALGADVIERFRRWIAGGARFEGDESVPLVDWVEASGVEPPPAEYAYPMPVAALVGLGEDRWAMGGLREVLVRDGGGGLVRRLAGLPERVQALALHPDGRRLYFAGGEPGRSGAAGWLELDGDGSPRVLARASDWYLALAISPAGDLVAAGGTARDIGVWDTATGERVATLAGHSDWVLDLAFSPDGERLVSAGRDGTARVFGARSGEWFGVFRGHGAAVTAVVFGADGERVASAGRDGRIRTWEAATGGGAKGSPGVAGQAVRLRSEGERLWSAWSDGRVREHRWETLEPVREFGEGGERLTALALAPGLGEGRLATGSQGGWVRMWETEGGAAVRAWRAVPGGGGEVKPDG
ncbi:MAG: hypothetical protein KF833_16465 [Verrucomicrobiae bacterium]|nr:hypothetical protein [Verrucomicrobiae bacterium]